MGRYHQNRKTERRIRERKKMEEEKGKTNGKMKGVKDQSLKRRKIIEKRKKLGETKLERKVSIS